MEIGKCHQIDIYRVHYFVTWFESVFLLDNTNSTLSCSSNNFVGHLVDFRFNDSEAVKKRFISLVKTVY